jgi:hypothetical protein
LLFFFLIQKVKVSVLKVTAGSMLTALLAVRGLTELLKVKMTVPNKCALCLSLMWPQMRLLKGKVCFKTVTSSVPFNPMPGHSHPTPNKNFG